jgi:DeoR family glycerol-3-phosphate regulon repressor
LADAGKIGRQANFYPLGHDLTVVTDKPPSQPFMDVFGKRDITLITHPPDS